MVVALAVGPEVLAGSTRLKAGTATKLALNTLTTAAFVRLGKVYGNRMVDLQPRSAKLRARALRLVVELGGVSEREAARLLAAAGGRAKLAIVMARLGVDAREAPAARRGAWVPASRADGPLRHSPQGPHRRIGGARSARRGHRPVVIEGTGAAEEVGREAPGAARWGSRPTDTRG